MTESFRIEPGDPRYDRIYIFWLKNDKPAICQMSDGKFMTLSTDGMIVFIALNKTDEDWYQSISTTGIIK